jgi:hypothetical protein
MPHSVKRGDTKTLRWNLGRDLTGVSTARVIIKANPAATAAVDRAGVIDTPVTAGIVSLALVAGDYGPGKLEVTNTPALPYYLVEIETTPGPLTHPDDAHVYERLYVLQDLA